MTGWQDDRMTGWQDDRMTGLFSKHFSMFQTINWWTFDKWSPIDSLTCAILQMLSHLNIKLKLWSQIYLNKSSSSQLLYRNLSCKANSTRSYMYLINPLCIIYHVSFIAFCSLVGNQNSSTLLWTLVSCCDHLKFE